jgi:hypothetical protein
MGSFHHRDTEDTETHGEISFTAEAQRTRRVAESFEVWVASTTETHGEIRFTAEARRTRGAAESFEVWIASTTETQKTQSLTEGNSGALG